MDNLNNLDNRHYNKYQQGKIYKIISPNTEKIYIGSTIETALSFRMRSHQSEYRKWKAGNLRYVSSFEMIEAGRASIILVEAYPCNSKDELRAREQHHIDTNSAICTNKRKSYHPPGCERQQDNERKREKCNCECGGKFTRTHAARHYQTKKHKKYMAKIVCVDDVADL